MDFLIGVGLASAVCIFGRLSGFDRDRAFYATIVIPVATYYVLFAVMAGSMQALVAESMAALLFTSLAVAGFRRNMWLVAAALAGHGLFDFVHAQWIENPGVPVWWPGFCAGFDVLAGAFLGALLLRRSLPSQSTYRSS